MDMKTIKTLSPGEPGTKKELEKYGDKLVCVRYKYDKENQKKVKTVEVEVARQEKSKNSDRIPFNKKIYVRIEYREKELRKAVKSVGASWDSEKKLWQMKYGDAYNLGLENRIVEK